MATYLGPVRHEPLAVELSNTIYAVRGEQIDGIADARSQRAWLTALADRLPVEARSVDPDRLAEFHELRAAVRAALRAAIENRPVPRSALAELNSRSGASPQSLALRQRGRKREHRVHHHGPTPTDIVLGVIAADAIALVSGEPASRLRACEAPGCVLLFLKDHPRREWCSTACGNRARQARHYRRRRAHDRSGS
jgi:predicted RNA-binding Zn ribbon-like protein